MAQRLFVKRFSPIISHYQPSPRVPSSLTRAFTMQRLPTNYNLISEFPCHPPPGSLADWYDKTDFVDSFSLRLPASAPGDARALARMLLGQPPAVFRVLMTLRDTVMRCFGVKTSSAIRSSTDDGRDRIDFFPIISESAGEVVVGEDDVHLDFRTSVNIVEAADPGLVHGGETVRLLVATTAVRRHNLLGRLYLWVIMPFHRRIVLHSLRRLGTKLNS